MKKRTFLVLGALALSLAVSGCSGEKGTIDGGVVRIAYNQAPTHPHYLALEKAGKEFEKATDGRFRFQIYPNEVLGDQRATVELIQNGAIQMAIVNNAMVENYNKDFSILGLPYIFDSEEHQKKVFTEGMLDPLFETTKKEGFEVLAAYTAGSRNVYTDQPIAKPEDLTGKKIRVMESPTMVAMMKYMGGVGTPMGQGDVYTAIQQGVLDGAENNEITYVDLKHYEVAPYFSKTQHVMIPDLVIADEKYISRMSKEDQDLLRQILKQSVEEEFTLWDQEVQKARTKAEENGVTFVDVNITPFQEQCLKIHKEAAGNSETSQNMYDLIRKAAQ